jgi:hypothetical protein
MTAITVSTTPGASARFRRSLSLGLLQLLLLFVAAIELVHIVFLRLAPSVRAACLRRARTIR